jgi:hypothetical protein
MAEPISLSHNHCAACKQAQEESEDTLGHQVCIDAGGAIHLLYFDPRALSKLRTGHQRSSQNARL